MAVASSHSRATGPAGTPSAAATRAGSMPGPSAAAVARISSAPGVVSPVAALAPAEPGDLAADGLPDAGRDRHLLDRGRAGAEQARHLGYEQRVALAAALHDGEHVGVRAGQHELDVPGGQARQDQRRAGRLERGDHVADVRVEGRLGGSVGGEQHDPGQPGGRREPQQQDGWAARRVQVIEDHGQRGGP